MKKVIISGGGTGGHIFPAIAIANALKKRVPDIDILFIGAKGRMEMTKVPAAGYTIVGLNIAGFQRRLTWKNLAFPFKLAGSMLKARSIIRKFNPDVVIGVGGYASGPTLRNATALGIPTIIQEQNSFPGVTNRILAPKVGAICVAYEGMERYFPKEKLIFTGNPIRQDLTEIAGKREAGLSHFGLSQDLTTLLVVGGSLGAGTINRAVMQWTKAGIPPGIQVLWQTGGYYYDSVVQELLDSGLTEGVTAGDSATRMIRCKNSNVTVLPFVDRMDLAYAAADLIVSRAGAIAISELCVTGKPVILVPSPNVAEDHQTKNARALADRDAAVMIADSDAMEKLVAAATSLLGDADRRATLARNIRALGITDAADRIAAEAMKLAGGPASAQQKSVYLLGIGGIGMSALARYFSAQGLPVAGYDKTPTPLTDQMEREGMKIHFNEDPSQVPDNPYLVIYTPAVPADHAELMLLKERGIPVKKRAEVLGQIASGYRTVAVAGTHGKTTTSTLVAHILHSAGLEMLAFLGGISKNYGTNYLSTLGETNNREALCVAEADEYDRSFLQLSPHLAIVTSADADHLDIYGNSDDMRRSFSEFTGKVIPGGTLIMRKGIPVEPMHPGNYRIFSYGLEGDADFRAENIAIRDGLFRFDLITPDGRVADLVLGLPGRFNLENAVAALAAARILGAGEDALRNAIASYEGVQRRFDYRVRKPGRIYIDDYAHHPEELRACIGAVRELYPGKRITGVFQPHLFSRTRDLADDFAMSLGMLDELILLDIYPAREKPIPGITSGLLLERVNLERKQLVKKEDLLRALNEMNPEVLLTLGAGDIDQFVKPVETLMIEMNDER